VDGRLDVNVALNCTSFQISTYVDGHGIYYPMYANDGNHDTRMWYGPCAVTNQETNPWWGVDLGVPLYVTGVKFTNCDSSGKLNVL